MINYETDNSPFFVANKNYLEVIESKLSTLDAACFGFCNSYGYNVETTLRRGNLYYHLKFHKSHSTQKGGIFPSGGIFYSGTEVIVTGLNKRFSARIGKSAFRRLFSAKAFRDKIPSPNFIDFNYLPESKFIDELAFDLKYQKFSKFTLRKGMLIYTLNQPIKNPLIMLSEIENTVKHWA